MCEKCKVIRRHRPGDGHLHQPAPQAAAGIGSHGTNRRSRHPPGEATRDLTHLHLRHRPHDRQKVCAATGIDATPGCATSPTRRSPASATGSTPTSRSRVTCAATSRRTSTARWRSARTRASATAAACPCEASAPTPTPAPARARRRPSPVRRRCKEVGCRKPKPGGRRPRKRERKNVTYGVVHIKSSFNNTIISITDRRATSSPGRRPATSGSRAPASRRRSPPSWPPRQCARGHGARRPQGRRAGEGSRLRPRDRDPLAHEHRHRGRRASRTSRRSRTTAAGRKKREEAARVDLMARYTGPVCRLCRREKMKLFLKGPKCDSMKCPIERRPYPPGEHGRDRHAPAAPSTSAQLREKQKARRIYGLLEKQFVNLYKEANAPAGHHRREPPAHARAAARQRRLPCRLGREPQPGPPVRAPRPRLGQRQAGHHPQLPRPQGRRRRAEGRSRGR